MNVQVRAAVPADIPRMNEIYAQADAYHARAYPDLFRLLDVPARTPEYLAGLMQTEDICLFVAEVEGEIAGLVQVMARETPDYPVLVRRRFVLVDTLAVDERFRRQGVATALMKAAHCWALEQGIHEIELSVYAFNQPAIALYQGLGYEVVSQRMRLKV